MFSFLQKPGAGGPKLRLGDILPPLQYPDPKYALHDSIYYHYKGSTTHPPCFGYLDWSIYDKPLKISEEMVS
jgi:hypothetical protein